MWSQLNHEILQNWIKNNIIYVMRKRLSLVLGCSVTPGTQENPQNVKFGSLIVCSSILFMFMTLNLSSFITITHWTNYRYRETRYSMYVVYILDKIFK